MNGVEAARIARLSLFFMPILATGPGCARAQQGPALPSVSPFVALGDVRLGDSMADVRRLRPNTRPIEIGLVEPLDGFQVMYVFPANDLFSTAPTASAPLQRVVAERHFGDSRSLLAAATRVESSLTGLSPRACEVRAAGGVRQMWKDFRAGEVLMRVVASVQDSSTRHPMRQTPALIITVSTESPGDKPGWGAIRADCASLWSVSAKPDGNGAPSRAAQTGRPA